MTIAPDESRRRAEAVAAITASTRLEGGEVPPETVSDLNEFIEGAIDEEGLLRRVRDRINFDRQR